VPEGSGTPTDRGVAEALRAAVERTLSVAGQQARTGSAALRPERATRLLDEVARRGAGAGAELARRSQGARDEVTARLESVERRLSHLEAGLRNKPKPKPED
jgi:hypothetical protein